MLPTMEGDLYVVNAPHFTAGIIVKDNKVTLAAPILKYMKGRSLVWVFRYCKGKQWSCKESK